MKNTRHAFGSMNRSFHCCDLHLTYVAPAQDAAMSEDLKDGSDPNPTDPKDPMSFSCFDTEVHSISFSASVSKLQ